MIDDNSFDPDKYLSWEHTEDKKEGDKKNLDHKNKDQNIKLRRKCFKFLRNFSIGLSIFIALVVVLCGLKKLKLDNSVIIALIIFYVLKMKKNTQIGKFLTKLNKKHLTIKK